MFEAKGEELMAELGTDRFMAALLATGARNGVEDLHAAGVFTDDEAPTLNRAMRNSLYDTWVALREGVNEERGNAQVFVDLCLDALAELDEESVTDDTVEDVLAGSCQRTARQFMESKHASEEDAHEFACAAAEEMRCYYRLWSRAAAGDPAEQDLRQLDMCVGLIATYWEPAELSSEFTALLDRE